MGVDGGASSTIVMVLVEEVVVVEITIKGNLIWDRSLDDRAYTNSYTSSM